MKASYKSLAFIFLLIIFISSANAEESKEEYNQRISVYFHPFSTIFIGVWENGLSTSLFDDESTIFIADLTVKIPLSLSNSLIIQPSFWNRSGPFLDRLVHYDDEKLRLDNLSRLGLGIGLRHFVNGKGDGLYFQAMSNVYHYSIREWNRSTYNNGKINLYYNKGYYADLLGYLGYSWKFSRLSMFSDIGIGTIYPINNSNYELMVGVYKKPFTFDMNLGIGLSF
ncbi:MAG: hypothetical protein LBC75_12395 [Fibromonadaceae bacterium]|jgi:hypothetical protein|nr:hypothetical protein [Fibromonadaceae bacterium]